MYYNLICILYALLCGQNFILVKSWCYSGGLAACFGEMVAARWVEVVAFEASASGSSDVGLESLVVASETEGAALALASVADSSGVT
jgi:hypothetical protein